MVINNTDAELEVEKQGGVGGDVEINERNCFQMDINKHNFSGNYHDTQKSHTTILSGGYIDSQKSRSSVFSSESSSRNTAGFNGVFSSKKNDRTVYCEPCNDMICLINVEDHFLSKAHKLHPCKHPNCEFLDEPLMKKSTCFYCGYNYHDIHLARKQGTKPYTCLHCVHDKTARTFYW